MEALREFGFVEEANTTIEWRTADGQPEFRSHSELRDALKSLEYRPDFVICVSEPLLLTFREEVVLLHRNRLASANKAKEYVRLGQLFSYGAELDRIWRALAGSAQLNPVARQGRSGVGRRYFDVLRL